MLSHIHDFNDNAHVLSWIFLLVHLGEGILMIIGV